MDGFNIKIEEESIAKLTADNQWDESAAEAGIEALKNQLIEVIWRLSRKYGVVPSKGDYIRLNSGKVYGIDGRHLKAEGDDFEVLFIVFETTRYASSETGS
jgi:hypothetical protein